MKYRFCFLCIWMVAFATHLYGDEIELRVRRMSTNDGLPNNTIRCMHQDSKGFLWLGTLNGLSRYDGNSFVTFRPEAPCPDKISLADNRVNKLHEDKNGFLWIGTMPELYSCYDLRRARFVDYTGSGRPEGKYANIFLASNGDVWLWGRGDGARRIVVNPDRTMTSTLYTKESGRLPGDRVNFVSEDRSGRIWLGLQSGLVSVDGDIPRTMDDKRDYRAHFALLDTDYFVTARGGIYRADTATGRMVTVAQVPGKPVYSDRVALKDKCLLLTSEGAYAYLPRTGGLQPYEALDMKRGTVLKDEGGDYWIYNHTGCLYHMDAHTERVRKLDLIPRDKLNYIDYERYAIARDARGICWISTYGNGLFAYEPGTGSLQHFHADASAATAATVLASDYLLFVRQDRNGGIWAGTEYAGLMRLDAANRGVTRLYPEPAASAAGRHNSIRTLHRSAAGDIRVATRRGGLYTYDAEMRPKADKQSYEYSVYAMEEDTAGCLWLGTRGAGLKIGDVWHHRNPADASTPAHSHIFCLHRDRKGRMWVGTLGGGLDLAVGRGDGRYRFEHFLKEGAGLRTVRAMAEDADGRLWVGTDEGLCIFHPDSLIRDKKNYRRFSLADGTFNCNAIRCLMRDSRNRMWVGTAGTGLNLCRLDTVTGTLRYTAYGTSEGLASDVARSILEDGDGMLWVGTEYGLSKLNPLTMAIENHFFSPHMAGNVYGENCACRCPDGRLLFGTEYGLTLIDPKQIPVREYPIEPVFTNLRVNGVRMTPESEESPLGASIAYSDGIRLKHYQNSFAIDFSTLDYSDSGETKYTCLLENYDKRWSTPSTLNFAAYKYIPPGTYVMRVKACNGAGVWNKREAALTIVVTPPFWKTRAAMLIYLLLAAAALWTALRLFRNFNRLRNRIDVEKKLTEYKLVFFTNISHEFRTPLTLIRGAMEKMKGTGTLPAELRQPLHTMDKSTARMLRLINQLLEFRKMQNGRLALSLEETDVVAFLHEIFLGFGDIAEQKKMDYRFLPSMEAYKMFIDKGNLDKVTYNLLSNAFKYTPSGGAVKLEVEVDQEAERLRIRVTDTGVGIPKEKRGELFKRFMQSSFAGDSIGVGLHLSHELVTVHKGTIAYAEREGGGSVFTVTLPTDKSVYDEKDFLIPGNVLLKEQEEQAACLSDATEQPAGLFAGNGLSAAAGQNGTAGSGQNTAPAAPLNKRKVLIIEDDNDIRAFLKEEVEAYFEVEVAEDGTAGLEKARAYDADLIICDVLMPGMNGFEVTRRLKADFETCHIPIVLLTALGSTERQLEGIKAGADAYIPKPFSVRLLLARVFQLIAQRDKLRDKFSNEPGIGRTAIFTCDRDKEFSERLVKVVEENLARPEFTVEEFGRLMGLGRTVFFKKIRGVTGYSPNEYLRVVRMKKGAELLLSPERYTVSEVAYKVGLNDPFYFSKCFKAQFGISPSVYQKGGKPKEEEQGETKPV